jgi:hypothetical protein
MRRPSSPLAVSLEHDGCTGRAARARPRPRDRRRDAQRLFQPFAAGGTAGDPRTGSGLGLAICHEIVLSPGGRIALDNRVQAPTLTGWTLSCGCHWTTIGLDDEDETYDVTARSAGPHLEAGFSTQTPRGVSRFFRTMTNEPQEPYLPPKPPLMPTGAGAGRAQAETVTRPS